MLGIRVHIKGLARQKIAAELKKAYDKGASIRTVTGRQDGSGWVSAELGELSLLMLGAGCDHGCHQLTRPLP
ncbi:helix-turn-helix domain-containing protein [Streptomyces sp. NPDC048002]|uniref:helix-turn-helix domain-containing protein n=1 Tax=Streptomyces sp. NPDC048002 TaxID=3154344 RepID=UPI0034109776